MSTINVTAVFPASGAINVTAALPTSAPINVLAGIPSTTINVSGTFGIGMQGEAGTSFDPKTNWFALVSGSISDDPEVAITGGAVTAYHYNGGVTRYRYEATDESADAFYTTFNGSTMPTGFIVAKALQF